MGSRFAITFIGEKYSKEKKRVEYEYGFGKVALNKLLLVVADMEESATRVTLLRPLYHPCQLSDGRMVDKVTMSDGVFQFQEQQIERWYVDADNGKDQIKDVKGSKSEEDANARAIAINAKVDAHNAKVDSGKISGPKLPRYTVVVKKANGIFNSVGVYSYGAGRKGRRGKYEDRTAGEILGNLRARLTKSGEDVTSHNDATAWIRSCLKPNDQSCSVAVAPAFYKTKNGLEAPIRATGVVTTTKNGVGIKDGSRSQMFFAPQGWKIAVKEGDELDNGPMFFPSNPRDGKLVSQTHRRYGYDSLAYETHCECCDNNSVIQFTGNDECPHCGDVVLPEVAVTAHLDKKCILVDVDEMPRWGVIKSLGIQHPSTVSHWEKVQKSTSTPMAKKLAVELGSRRFDNMATIGGCKKVNELVKILA